MVSIWKINTINWSAHNIGAWRRLQQACMYAWPRQGFRFSHKQSMQVEEDFEQRLDI